jgi:hypothetical protein
MVSTSVSNGITQLSTYARPVLQVYGDVKTLTASGTSGGNESKVTPGGSTCIIDNSRKPC